MKSRALGDAEFLRVFVDQAPLPEARNVQSLAQRIDSHLAGLGIVCPITLSPVHASYLRRLRPAIFAYELRTCGQVVWGEPTVLALIPSFSASDIPHEDAWHLLCNRLVEHLEVAPEIDEPSTYRRRAERLRALSQREDRADRYPFQLEPFARIVSACTEWKLDGADGPAPEGVAWYGVIERGRCLWRWELAQLTGASPGLPDQALLEAWLRRQPSTGRARGWLDVLRKCDWHQSWRLWPRWARLARRGSPRYLVYAAACRLLFERRLEAEGSDGTHEGGRWERLCEDLPVIRPEANRHRPLPWQEAVSEIIRNYREFLVNTRA